MAEGELQTVPVTTDLPFRRICLLKVRRGEQKPRLGTGWLFGDSLVITARHVVFDAGQMDVTAWAARHDASDKPFGVWNSVRVVLSARHDYAGVVLNEPIGRRVGTFGIASLDSISMSERAVITGYTEADEGRTQQTGEGAVTSQTPTHFNYGVFTASGQSGSPVWMQGNSDLVAGIHVASGRAITITDEVLEELLRWRDGSS